MHEGEASHSAVRVAVKRALHQRLDRPLIFEDPFALAVLPPSVRERVELDPGSFDASASAQYSRTFLAVRSRLAEDELGRAVERGVRQYVVLGAGYDTFALRNPFSGEGLRVFELDHPATQKAKLAQLAAEGVQSRPGASFTSVDLSTTSLDDGLERAGFDRSQPSVFAWLGVTMYLGLEAIRAALRAIATLPDATVVFDPVIRPRWYEVTPRLLLARRMRGFAKVGEPWRTLFNPNDLAQELTDARFRTTQLVAGEELTRRYVSGTNQRLKNDSMIAIANTR